MPKAEPVERLNCRSPVRNGFRGIAEPFVVGYGNVGYRGEGVIIFSGIEYPF
jgi:hypothetical protein